MDGRATVSDRYLTGRAAMVTGGGSGQGRAVALALAAAGADVAIGSLTASSAKADPREDTYFPPADELEAVRRAIEAKGVRAIACDLDVRSNDSVQAFHDATVAAFGKVDILANVAGVSLEQSMVGHPDHLWHAIIDVNLNGYYRTIKRCLPGMIERQWGRIICVASTSASVGAANNAAYGASKAAVLGLMRCVALEGAPHGVTCNAISPGFVETKVMRKALVSMVEAEGRQRTPEQLIAEVKNTYPQKRIIEPEEIANVAAFLCREESRGITMENITVAAGALW
jgi:NAD(P)-dependent dehydrogenase (short-subunit alcohol dehydrogenase family)